MQLDFAETNHLDFLTAIANSIGSRVNGNKVDVPAPLGTGFIKGFQLNAHLQLVIRSYTLTEALVLKKFLPKTNQSAVMITLYNVFNTRALASLTNDATAPKTTKEIVLPSAQITTVSFDSELHLPARTQMNALVITVEAAYLKQLLHPQPENMLLQTITSGHQDFLFDEFVNPYFLDVVAELLTTDVLAELRLFFLKVKTEELIFLLFSELLKRQAGPFQLLNTQDVNQLYQLKDQLLTDLAHPPRLSDLATQAGMSVSKLKRLFKQVFGQGIYHFYQCYRIQQAAYLIREEKLSVSEAGYRMGFTNLSHFTRLFATHIGLKPKQYALMHSSKFLAGFSMFLGHYLNF